MLFRELESDRLLLKNVSPEDRDFIFAQFSNKEVNRYLFDAEPLNELADADEIIEFYKNPEQKKRHRWVLVRKSDGSKIGTCGFHCWDQANANCEIGYDLYPEFWGQGYMSEAMREILAFARNDMGVKRINACIYPDNHASVRLAEKFGFAYSGQMKDEIFHGQRYPHKIFVLDYTQ